MRDSETQIAALLEQRTEESVRKYEDGGRQTSADAGAEARRTLPSGREIARFIDHSLLRPEATEKDIDLLCSEALEHGFAAVCVNSGFVPFCEKRLTGTTTAICSVVGFPLGAMSHEIKAAEAEWVIQHGAREIDMVIAIGRLISHDFFYVYNDIFSVVQAARGLPVKVILETGLLNEKQKISGCELALEAGARFVKTCTGFGPGGATEDDVRLMRKVVGDRMGVKASGGIRDRATALRMIAAGATRIGCSNSVTIIGEES